jgi:hypothetical protein
MKEVYVGAVQNLVVCPRRHGGAAGLWQCEAGKASQPPLATQDPTARNARSVQIDHVKVCIGLKPLATINRHSVRGSVYGARLEERWQAHRRRVHVVENPHTAQRDQSSDDHARQCSHQHSQQRGEGGENPLSGIPEFLCGLVKCKGNSADDKDKKDLFPRGPRLPGNLRQSADLADRPGPDQLHKLENRRDSLLQKLQQLVEELLHLVASGCPRLQA